MRIYYELMKKTCPPKPYPNPTQKLRRRIISLIILITFLTSNLAYGYDNRGVSEPVLKSHLRGEQVRQANGTGKEMATAMGTGRPQYESIVRGIAATSAYGTEKLIREGR